MADAVVTLAPPPAAAPAQRPRKRKSKKGTKGKRRTGSKSKKQSPSKPQPAAPSTSGFPTGLLLAVGLPVVGLVGAAFLLTKFLRKGGDTKKGGPAAGGNAQDAKRKEAVAKAMAAVPFAYTHRQLIDLIMVVRAAGTPADAEEFVTHLRQDQLMHIIQGAQKAPEEFQELVQALASVGIRIMVRPAGAGGAGGQEGAAGGSATKGGAAGAGGAAAEGAAGTSGRGGFPAGTMTMEDYLQLVQQQRQAQARAQAAGGAGGAASSGAAGGLEQVPEGEDGEDGDELFDEEGDMFEEGDFGPEEDDFELDDNGDFDHYDH